MSSGETTVRVTGSGRGGRNQEFGLAASHALRRLAPAAAASVGTDGIDGPTDAAGAIVDSDTLDRARRAGLASPSAFLRDNDAYRSSTRWTTSSGRVRPAPMSATSRYFC